MNYTNPVLPGFHPDPSICRVQDDYFLVTSSFEYFPSIPLFHSRNLIDWEQIGYCVTKSEWLPLMCGVPNSSGIYAPTIRFHNGRYYVITTNVSTKETGEPGFGNFIITAEDPYGEWSKPVWLDSPGIDPSLFFDEFGAVYCCGSCNGIFLYQIDVKTGARLSELKYIWQGTGGTCPEGPHIYRRGGWYYLMIAEGGTEYGHMVTMARSRSVWGPYEACPHNPVLSNRSTGRPIMATGHADLVEDGRGNWWAVCLGNRPICYPPKHNLGRETNLVPVLWQEDGWPQMGNNGVVEQTVETEQLPEAAGWQNSAFNQMPKPDEDFAFQEDFRASSLNVRWNYLYGPDEQAVHFGDETGLRLKGKAASLSDAAPCTFLGCRQEHHVCTVRVRLSFQPKCGGEEAGLAIYLNREHHYEAALTRQNGENLLILRRTIGSLWRVEQAVPCNAAGVTLEIAASKETYAFSYSVDGEHFTPLGGGEACYLTTEVGGGFTGCCFALYASGNGAVCENPAYFTDFHYTAKGVQ